MQKVRHVVLTFELVKTSGGLVINTYIGILEF